MAKTLEAIRADLARATGQFLTGTATGGSTTTIIDTNGLAHLGADDMLKGGLAYIRAAGGAAPEDESRRITGYTASSKTVTVEYAFTAAPESGDTYEVYLPPLSLAQWDWAINQAILDAWPGVWKPCVYEVSATAEQESYSMPSAASAVLAVRIRPGGAALLGWPARRLPRPDWEVDGFPGSLTLYLHRPPTSTGHELSVTYKAMYASLAAAGSTDLDESYLLAAARANLYQVMADEAGGQADASRFLQLMNHWQEQAGQIRDRLERELLGMFPGEGKKK